MRKIGFVLLGVLCSGMLRAEAAVYDGPAAFVNDKVVTIDTVMKELHASFDLAQLPPARRAEKVREMFPAVRELLIDRMLILKAYEDSGARLPEHVVTERIQAILADEFGGDEAKLVETLRRGRMTKAEWMRHVRENIIVAAMRQLQVGKKVSVSPQKVKTYFAEHMDEFAVEGGVRVRTILLTPAQGDAAAEEALAALEKGEAFEAVARRLSSDSQAAQGGDWGFVKPEETFAPAVVAALAALKPGERSGVIEQGGWRTIVQKVEVRAGRMMTLAEAWPEVEAIVRAQEGQARYEAWLRELRRAAWIRVVEVALP